MPPSRVEVVRAANEAANQGDLDAGERLLDPDVEIHTRLVGLEGGVYRGLEGNRAYLAALDETFESFERELTEIVEIGERVVAGAHVHAVGRGSGVVVDQDFWSIFEFSGERISRFEVFLDRDEAFAAAEA